MIRKSCKAAIRFSIGTSLTCLLFALSSATARAESAVDYAAPFNFLTQFDPAALTPDGNGNYLLQSQLPGSGIGNIRFFIPTGAIRININFYAAADAQIGMAARYNLPAQCDYSHVSYPYWFCFPWDKDGGKLSELTDTDMRFRNRSGHAFVVDQYYPSPLTQGGWLYLKVLDPDVRNDISVFEYKVIVNGDAYRAWHALGSVPAASGTVSGGCAFTATPDCAPSSSTTPTTPSTPTPGNATETRLVVEIDTAENGMGGEKVYRDSDLINHIMITLSSSLKFEGLPSENVDCFAMIVANGGAITLIYRETLFDGPSWMPFIETDNIIRFRGENIGEKSIWSCNAFDILNKLKLPPGFFTANRLQFIYAIAPVGEVAMGKYENLRYGIISFLPDE